MKFETEIELEEAMIPLLDDYFKQWSFQVANHSCVIDFGGLNKNNQLIGIEFKLKDWKRAIWQAHSHRLCYDFLYILMPKKKISEALKDEAKKVGIGVLLFDGQQIEVKIKPKKQECFWSYYRKQTRLHLQVCPLNKRRMTKKEYIEYKLKIQKFNLINNGI